MLLFLVTPCTAVHVQLWMEWIPIKKNYIPWYIQNLGIFRIGGISRTLSSLYDGVFCEIVNGYNYFRNMYFSPSLLYEINISHFLNTGLIFTPGAFILRKKAWGFRGLGAMNCNITFKKSLNITYFVSFNRLFFLTLHKS